MTGYRGPVDPRDLKGGRVVSDRNGYYDSQNVVAVGDPPVLSVILHHSENREGGPGLRLYATRSTDLGRTWSALQLVESAERQSHDGYQLVQRRPDGSERILLLYGWNRGSHPPLGDPLRRTDMQLDEGYWLRVSDDHGATWGDRRHLVPVRRTRIDRENPWCGDTMGMFLCDKPAIIDGAVYAAFQKTTDGAGETFGSEVFLLRSRNLLTVHDPDDADWETLPAGDVGLRPPEGDLGEEPHVLAVGDRLLVLWRTEVGKLAAAMSDDGGESFGESFWLTYDGVHPIRNPRGSITPYRLQQDPSEYVMLFYNNGRTERLGYVGRRVYWITHGRERDGTIEWSQPEIALWWDGTGFEDRPGWNPDWAIVDGPGYPDWVELPDGTLAFVESNKLAVRYHQVDRWMLDRLRRQRELAGIPDESLVLDVPGWCSTVRGPVLVDTRTGGGFSITAQVGGRPHGTTLVSAMSDVTAALGEEPTDARIVKGYRIDVSSDGEVQLHVTDGFGVSLDHRTHIAAGIWDGEDHVITFIVDGGPKVVSVVVDDRLDDGGDTAPQGWAFFDPDLGEVGGVEVTIPPDGFLRRLLVFDRPLLTSEAIGVHRFLAQPG